MRSAVAIVVFSAFFLGISAQIIAPPVLPLPPASILDVWHCGTEHFPLSSGISNKLFGFGCKSTLAINECCLHHDQCYCQESMSRTVCDGDFCECLRRVAQNDNFFCRVILMESTCFLASKLGNDPFGNCPQPFLERIGLLGRWKKSS